MSFEERYLWRWERFRKRQKKRRQLIVALLAFQYIENQKHCDHERVSRAPIFEKRRLHGFYLAIFPALYSNEKRFRDYFRMSPKQFDQLLRTIRPFITASNVISERTSAGEKLALTLRFLASGDSIESLSYQYQLKLSSVSNIVTQMCEAIWDCLHKNVLPSDLVERNWLNISKDFEKRWNFKHCIGAIDCKHILIQCPDNDDSKNNPSLVILGICDANYKFTFIDIGNYGRLSDSSIFRSSLIGQKFDNEEMNLPESYASDEPPLPYVLIGDEAFPLKNYLLRPYPDKTCLNQERKIYNYRLSHAQRSIENAFGILVSQWEIFRRPFITSVDQTMKIIKAIVCLHNWLCDADDENQYITSSLVDKNSENGFIPGSWRKCIDKSAFQDITRCGTNNSTRTAIDIREEFSRYFNKEGAVPWQFNECRK